MSFLPQRVAHSLIDKFRAQDCNCFRVCIVQLCSPHFNSSRRVRKFSIIPLCTTETAPLVWGCAFFSLGSPCVAHLVCPIPAFLAVQKQVCLAILLVCQLLAVDRVNHHHGGNARAIVSRYSKCFNASTRIGAASCLPKIPLSLFCLGIFCGLKLL